MTDTQKTQENISKSLENPLLGAIKKDALTDAISAVPEKKRLLPDQISPSLDKFENAVSKKREQE